ncbi:MAG: thymidine phosphorylase [Candidatus Spyradocola sp.]|jgi:pyrimidine-nucleoside phosphorylase
MANMLSILEKKKRGERLSPEEIAGFVHGVYDGSVPDYQTAALLMAIRLQGMDEAETAALTLEMARTGAQADLSSIPGVKVDKHSTGGVGDLTTLVAVPLCAACGGVVAKMSGRALGHTGGTLDKLASIPGMRTDLSMEAFLRQVRQIGCAVIGQTGDLAPVDKALYALRDVTATVDSIPLIASSILSKKIAAGCDAILLDVKTGSGALMPTLKDSRRLAEEMVRIGKAAGRRISALITDMDEPLGRLIGNALEVKEAVSILRGEETGRARDLCLEVAARMVSLGSGETVPDARKRVETALRDGSGLEKLCQMVSAQGGDARALENTDLLPGARLRVPLCADRDGFVAALAARDLGLASNALGAGRARKEDAIDYGVGIECCVRVGDPVRRGQTLLLLHANDEARVNAAMDLARGAVRLAEQAPAPRPLLFGTVE